MTSRTRALVAGATSGLSRITSETVLTDTPAAPATSRPLTRFLRPLIPLLLPIMAVRYAHGALPSPAGAGNHGIRKLHKNDNINVAQPYATFRALSIAAAHFSRD